MSDTGLPGVFFSPVACRFIGGVQASNLCLTIKKDYSATAQQELSDDNFS